MKNIRMRLDSVRAVYKRLCLSKGEVTIYLPNGESKYIINNLEHIIDSEKDNAEILRRLEIFNKSKVNRSDFSQFTDKIMRDVKEALDLQNNRRMRIYL